MKRKEHGGPGSCMVFDSCRVSVLDFEEFCWLFDDVTQSLIKMPRTHKELVLELCLRKLNPTEQLAEDVAERSSRQVDEEGMRKQDL